MGKTATRTRVLVTALQLFNEQGVAATTTNQIADEVDISPGNLHYHFRRKSDLVSALLDEFQADASRLLDPPGIEHVSLDDFWVFLHLLLETIDAYRFLLRDSDALYADYPQVRRVLRAFSRGLASIVELYLRGLDANEFLAVPDEQQQMLSRNIVVIALYSERLDLLTGSGVNADDSALHSARSILGLLLPYANRANMDSAAALQQIKACYE